MRIKDICSFVSRGTTPNYVDFSEYSVINQATFSKGFFDLENIRYTDNNKPNALVKDNDLLMASTGGGVLGKVYYYQKFDENKYYADSHVTILRTEKSSAKLLYYVFLIKYDYINSNLAKGSTNQTELQRDKLLNFTFSLPPLATQHAIADYLDKKLAVIDRKISLLEKKKERYAALRKSLINITVRHGLNPDAELKESGVEWLGKIPKHWEVKRMKEINSAIETGNRKDMSSDDVVSIGGEHIQNSEFYLNNIKYVSNENWENSKGKIEINDILVVKDGATIGKNMLVRSMPFDKMLLNEHVYRVKLSNKYSYLFYYFIFNTDYVQDYFRAMNMSSAQEAINLLVINNLHVPLPPLSEQRAIADYLDSQSEKIDCIVENINGQLEKLIRLKKSLINECVTGEREVV